MLKELRVLNLSETHNGSFKVNVCHKMGIPIKDTSDDGQMLRKCYILTYAVVGG